MGRINTRLTYEHLRQMPDDGRRYELIEGNLVMTPVPGWKHQRVVARLFELLCRAERAGFGVAVTAPMDVVLDPHRNAVQPDLLFIQKERVSEIVTDQNVSGAPDLVVEVLSEASAERDLGVKMRVYARSGVRFYWVADPVGKMIRAYELQPGGYVEKPLLRGSDVLTCPLFPGIAMSVEDVFAG